MSLSFIYTFFIIYGLSITPLLADKDSPPIVGIIVSFVVALFFSFITYEDTKKKLAQQEEKFNDYNKSLKTDKSNLQKQLQSLSTSLISLSTAKYTTPYFYIKDEFFYCGCEHFAFKRSVPSTCKLDFSLGEASRLPSLAGKTNLKTSIFQKIIFSADDLENAIIRLAQLFTSPAISLWICLERYEYNVIISYDLALTLLSIMKSQHLYLAECFRESLSSDKYILCGEDFDCRTWSFTFRDNSELKGSRSVNPDTFIAFPDWEVEIVTSKECPTWDSVRNWKNRW